MRLRTHLESKWQEHVSHDCAAHRPIRGTRSVMTSKSALVTPQHLLNCYTMQYDGYSIGEGPTWGVRSPRDGESDFGMVKDTMRKEQVIKSVLSTLKCFCFGVLSLNSGRSWLHKRISRVCISRRITLKWVRFCKHSYVGQNTSSAEVDKLTSRNETLQMYIDNLTVQMEKRRWWYHDTILNTHCIQVFFFFARLHSVFDVI